MYDYSQKQEAGREQQTRSTGPSHLQNPIISIVYFNSIVQIQIHEYGTFIYQ